MRMDMPVDALARLVDDFGQQQAADLAPADDVAVRELFGRLRVQHLCRQADSSASRAAVSTQARAI